MAAMRLEKAGPRGRKRKRWSRTGISRVDTRHHSDDEVDEEQHKQFEEDPHNAVGDVGYFRILYDLAEPPETPVGPTSLADEITFEDSDVAVNREVEVEFGQPVGPSDESEDVVLSAHVSKSSTDRRQKLLDIIPVDVINDSEKVPAARLQEVYTAVLEKERLSKEERDELEKLTRDQHESGVWHAEHCGRITSSMIHRVAKRKASTQPDKLVADILWYNDTGRTSFREGDPREHGHHMEPVALQHYLAEKGDKVTVSRHGLFVSEDHPFLATSTDGLVHEDGNPVVVGVLEIKCPASDEAVEVLCCTKKKFCLEFDGSAFRLKKNHQLQMEMGITGCKWADFVVFTMTAAGPSLHVERVSFNPAVFNSDRAKAILFYKNFVVLELLTRRVQRCVPLAP